MWTLNTASAFKAKAKKYKAKTKAKAKDQGFIFKSKATNYRKRHHLPLKQSTAQCTALWKCRCYDKCELLYIEENFV